MASDLSRPNTDDRICNRRHFLAPKARSPQRSHVTGLRPLASLNGGSPTWAKVRTRLSPAGLNAALQGNSRAGVPCMLLLAPETLIR